MKNLYWRTFAGLLGVVLLVGVAVMSGGRIALAQGEFKVKTPRERLAERSFPNVTLTTHEGKKVKFYDDLMKDKIVLINFMYVKCEGTCPGTTTNLVKVQKLLGDRVGKDIFMYSITLKPEEDTPEKLAAYAKAYKVGPGWQFLTGDPKDVELLRQKLGFIDRDPVRDANKSNHIGMLRWGNEPHTLWAGCPASLPPAKIVKEIGLVDWPTAEEAQKKRMGGGGDR
ncbi:MAG TPA: SCO family protein [Pyrinomonadaceae bacterium]|nr:SCO family protein [Pyrinomonadaceae bacterium]